MSFGEYWEEIGLTLGGLSAGIAGALKIKKPASPGKDPELEKMKRELAEQNDKLIRLETTVDNFIAEIREDKKEARDRDTKIFDRIDSLSRGLAMMQGRKL